jgi:hypothetical protein
MTAQMRIEFFRARRHRHRRESMKQLLRSSLATTEESFVLSPRSRARSCRLARRDPAGRNPGSATR